MRVSNLLKTGVYRGLHWVEGHAASLWLRYAREKPGLNVFMFHRIDAEAAPPESHEIMPHQETTVQHFREFIACMTDAGYSFVRPQDLPACRKSPGHYAMITFDDGYFDVLRALPVLEEFNVPAVFFISTRFVLEQKAFWTDVLYRQLMRQAVGPARLGDTFAEFNRLPTPVIEQRLEEQFGTGCLRPLGEVDRTLTAGELARFAQHPLVVIGNHTANHAVLTLYPESEIANEIALAQKHLREITGRLPDSIAYPGGQCNARIVELARSAGLQFGFTGVSGRWSERDLREGDFMTIPRIALAGSRSIERQCLLARANIQIYQKLKGNSSGSNYPS